MTTQLNQSVAEFAEKFTSFKAVNQASITALENEVETHLETLDELLDDYAGELKSSLGANAANEAGEDKDAQESAIAEAEEWVTDNVSNGSIEDRIAAVLWVEGCEAGVATLRNKLPSSETVTVRLTLDVTYSLNGENATEMVSRLRQMCERAIGEGMLTGESDAEVEDYSVSAVIQPEPLSEVELSDFMLQRIENGDLALEDLPVRLARYGLMEPTAFVYEMRQRMELSKEANSSWAITLTMESGTKFDWTGEADDQGHAEGQAIAEAVAKTGEQVLDVVRSNMC